MARDWWQGNQGAPTTGYGSFDARPAAPEPMLDALIDDDTKLDAGPEQAKLESDKQAKLANIQAQIDNQRQMIQQKETEMASTQGAIINFSHDSYMQKSYQSKLVQQRTQLMHLQQKMQQLQQQLAQV